MVDIPIPRVTRQTQDVPLLSDRTSAQVSLPENKVGDAIGVALEAGSKFYEQQLEASANQYAADSYLQIRDKFNKAFQVGENGKLGLKNIEGHEQFVQARNELTEQLNLKKAELLAKPELSKYAQSKAEAKIDEAMGTFQYYMDVQEGQVKTAERVKQTALTVQAKTEDLNNIFSKGFDPESGQSIRLLDSAIKDIRNTLYDSMVDSGTASKTIDKNGNAKYSVSTLGQFEVKKQMSKIVAEFTELIAAKPDGAKKAKGLLDNFDGYILPATKIQLEKYVNARALNTDAYQISNELVNLKNASPEDINNKVSELISAGEIEKAEKVQKLVPILLEKNRAVVRQLSRNSADVAYQMVLDKGYTSLAAAEQDPDFLKQ